MKPAGVQTLRSTFVALPHLLNTQRNARRRDPEYTNTQESDGSVICTHTANTQALGPSIPVNIQRAGWPRRSRMLQHDTGRHLTQVSVGMTIR